MMKRIDLVIEEDFWDRAYSTSKRKGVFRLTDEEYQDIKEIREVLNSKDLDYVCIIKKCGIFTALTGEVFKDCNVTIGLSSLWMTIEAEVGQTASDNFKLEDFKDESTKDSSNT